ncbi:MAG: protein phosphatase 2C domain-containing protein [Erythrobacter sp.]
MSAFERLFRKPTAMMSTVRSVSRTHVGRVRAVNEDRILDRADLGLWAVADGMGGHSAGDVAAEFLINELASWGEQNGGAGLRETVLRAHRNLIEMTSGEGGTTLVAMLAGEGEAQICWAGDSRAYLIRAGELSQLTRDHSLVQGLLDAGLIDEAGSQNHPQASVITSALGVSTDPLIESRTLDVAPGDRVLLCSDGLSRSLSERDVAGAIALAALADRLMTSALQRDGGDNVSLVLIEFA